MYRDVDVPVEPALVVLTQVTSRPAPDRVIVDAGRKTIDPGERPPRPRNQPGVRALALSAEHGTILLERPAECPRVGDRIELEVGYHDRAVHLHEVIVGVRNGIIEAVWPVAARGRLQ
ncbi:MAG: hypothetical protein KatS3mg059_0743 [Thermomicrobiales bacterium]|nr:MAG: hypothetical protein KatS3mg059_0743 [Thermomicrobiales bacterium]